MLLGTEQFPVQSAHHGRSLSQEHRLRLALERGGIKL
jgi:hypothetical protein